MYSRGCITNNHDKPDHLIKIKGTWIRSYLRPPHHQHHYLEVRSLEIPSNERKQKQQRRKHVRGQVDKNRHNEKGRRIMAVSTKPILYGQRKARSVFPAVGVSNWHDYNPPCSRTSLQDVSEFHIVWHAVSCLPAQGYVKESCEILRENSQKTDRKQQNFFNSVMHHHLVQALVQLQ